VEERRGEERRGEEKRREETSRQVNILLGENINKFVQFPDKFLSSSTV
jgi:hypothetical protein